MKKHLLIITLLVSFIYTLPVSASMGEGNNPVSVAQKTDDGKVVLYPNPATTVTQLKVTSADAKIMEVSIYGILGNEIYRKSFNGVNDVIQLNVSNFKKGKYLVRVIFSDGTSEVKALIKQ